MTRKPNRQDLLSLFERLVSGDPDDESRITTVETYDTVTQESVVTKGTDLVVVPMHLAQYVLDLAKKAKWPSGPHTKISNSVIIARSLVIHRARRRKSELEDVGLTATAALAQAADEVAKTEDAKRLRLSASFIKDQMQRKRSRC